MKLTIFTVLLLLCSLEKGQAQNTCTPFAEAPACGCTLADGKVIDLSSVGKRNEPAFSAKIEDFTYTYNPCYPFTTAPGCTDVAGCQQYRGYDRSLGVQTDVKFSLIDDDVVINYYGGVGGRSFEVMLRCGVEEDKFVFNEENPIWHYRFTLTTRCACPDYCNGGSSSDPDAI